jgi:hypothetical protein
MGEFGGGEDYNRGIGDLKACTLRPHLPIRQCLIKGPMETPDNSEDALASVL